MCISCPIIRPGRRESPAPPTEIIDDTVASSAFYEDYLSSDLVGLCQPGGQIALNQVQKKAVSALTEQVKVKMAAIAGPPK
jgi:hypothetical protein